MAPALRLAGAVLIAVTAAACFETTGSNYVVYEPGTAKKAKAAPAAKKSAPAPAPAKPGLADEVRAQLRRNCVLEHGGLFGGGEKTAQQCECFAGGIVKTMRRDHLEFYAQYKVLPTLGVANPEDVRKQCGIGA